MRSILHPVEGETGEIWLSILVWTEITDGRVKICFSLLQYVRYYARTGIELQIDAQRLLSNSD